MLRLKLLQVINYEKRFRDGFLPQIHRSITTPHVKPITMGPLRGSLKAIPTMNGRRQALSYGPMEVVCFSINAPPTLLMISDFVAGSGKSVLWWVTLQPAFVDITYVGV